MVFFSSLCLDEKKQLVLLYPCSASVPISLFKDSRLDHSDVHSDDIPLSPPPSPLPPLSSRNTLPEGNGEKLGFWNRLKGLYDSNREDAMEYDQNFKAFLKRRVKESQGDIEIEVVREWKREVVETQSGFKVKVNVRENSVIHGDHSSVDVKRNQVPEVAVNVDRTVELSKGKSNLREKDKTLVVCVIDSTWSQVTKDIPHYSQVSPILFLICCKIHLRRSR